MLAATWAHAALRPQSQIFGRTLIAGKDTREMALTYDDGPNDRCTEALLDVLAEHNAKATFFMIGRFVRMRPELARRVHEAGHLIGNHTTTHPWLAWQSARRIREELRGCHEDLQQAIGAPVRYFRPPHGARRPVVLRAAAELGMTTVQWNAMGYDWEPIAAPEIVANVEREIALEQDRGRGGNILLHDGSDIAMGADRRATVQATRMLLERMQRDGKRFVTVNVWARNGVAPRGHHAISRTEIETCVRP